MNFLDRIDQLNKELARVTAERRQEYDELREAGAKRENALRAELDKVTAERDQERGMRQTMETRHGEVVADLAGLRSKLAKVTAERDSLVAHRDFDDNATIGLCQDNAVLRARVAELEEDCANGRIAYNLLMDDKAQAEQRNAELVSELRVLIDVIDQAQQTHEGTQRMDEFNLAPAIALARAEPAAPAKQKGIST